MMSSISNMSYANYASNMSATQNLASGAAEMSAVNPVEGVSALKSAEVAMGAQASVMKAAMDVQGEAVLGLLQNTLDIRA